jgi:hypothetical protein
MKVRDTSQGRMYAISSEIGCTAINGAMAIDIPAGGQSVILALDKKIVIDGDDAAKFVEVRWGTNTAVGSRPVPSWLSDVLAGLVSIVGEANFDINYIPAENKLYLQFSLEVTTEQIKEVRSLLDRVLPRNLVTEMEWADGLPIDYTHVEYLENINGGDNNSSHGYSASIRTDIKPTQNTRGKLVADAVMTPYNHTYYAFGCSAGVNGAQPFGCPWWNRKSTGNDASFSMNGKGASRGADNMSAGVHILEFGKDGFIVDGVLKGTFSNVEEFESPRKLMFLSETPNAVTARCFRGKAYSFQLWENDVPILNFVPALDPTGAPCFFDLVTKEPYYSVTRHDFTYPGKETEATTYSLRNRMYAQYTEHGIRRLYRVPKGYNGSKEEYAAEHGFKILVETPVPEDGYWTPVWHDREDCIELEWVEVEPPTEEELQIEEIENA